MDKGKWPLSKFGLAVGILSAFYALFFIIAVGSQWGTPEQEAEKAFRDFRKRHKKGNPFH